MSIFDSSTPALSGQKVPCDVGNSHDLSLGPAPFEPKYHEYTEADTAATLAELAQFISPGYQLNMNGQSVRGGRKLSPVVSGNPHKDADYKRLRESREAGCERACGMDAGPKLPICTKCFINLHAGKWTGDVANGEFNFGHGDNWHKNFTLASKVRGWIKPSELPNG